jgi:hypothetical protein
MAKSMMTLRLDPTEANVASVKAKFGLRDDEIDSTFGVVCIDPAQNLYTILVDETTGAKLAGREGVSGPYANPKIEPFGPPTS